MKQQIKLTRINLTLALAMALIGITHQAAAANLSDLLSSDVDVKSIIKAIKKQQFLQNNTCNGKTATKVIKTSGTFNGGNGTADVILVAADNVTVNGRGKDDSICVFAYAANVTVDGGNGDDYIEGATYMPNVLWGGEGNDVIYGGTKDDYIVGGNGGDEFVELDGNDEIYGNGGYDTIFGENGDDFIVVNGKGSLYPGFGNDVVIGSGLAGKTMKEWKGFCRRLREIDTSKVAEFQSAVDANGYYSNKSNDLNIEDYKGDNCLMGSNGSDSMYAENGSNVMQGFRSSYGDGEQIDRLISLGGWSILYTEWYADYTDISDGKCLASQHNYTDRCDFDDADWTLFN